MSAGVLVGQLPGRHATAWHYFHDAARLLVGADATGPSGLHLYRDHPELQFGPVSIVAALPLSLFGERAGSWVAMGAASVLGLVAFGFVLRTLDALGTRTSRVTSTAAGALFVAVWGDIAVRTAHIDDAIALSATAAATWACARRDARTAAVLLGIAAAAKPWALAFAPLALAVPSRQRAAHLLVVAAIPALTWLPFVLAEPATLDVAEHRIEIDPTSTLRAFGVDDDGTPRWTRPAQVIGGMVLAWWAVRAGRWHAAVLAAVSWRLLLEPGAHRYYTAGAVLGALLVEPAAAPRALPWRAAGLALVLELTALPDAPAVAGRWARVCAVVGALVAVAVARRVSPACARSPARAPASSSATAP
ncbi:MAG TPA: hypothetical protein VF183_00155 [Acidimicrobiales bacterium]